MSRTNVPSAIIYHLLEWLLNAHCGCRKCQRRLLMALMKHIDKE